MAAPADGIRLLHMSQSTLQSHTFLPSLLDVCKALDERTFVRIDIDLVLCVYLEGRCTWFVSVIDCLSIKICSVIQHITSFWRRAVTPECIAVLFFYMKKWLNVTLGKQKKRMKPERYTFYFLYSIKIFLFLQGNNKLVC